MPGSTVALAQSTPVGTGRLNHVHYVPVYNAHRLRKKQRKFLEQELSNLQKFKLPPLPTRERRENKPRKSARSRQLGELLQTQTFQAPSSYTGARPPLLPKINKQEIVEKSAEERRRERLEDYEAKRAQLSAFLAEQKIAMASESASRIREENGVLRLPQIMKSFIPTEGRKLPARPQPESKSSWIDLTGNRHLKQVAPRGYKASTFDISVQPVTIVTVDCSRTQQKLQRKPLPPLRNTTPQTIASKSKSATVWHPSDSQSKLGDIRGSQAQQHDRSNTTKSPKTDAGKKLLDSLGQKLERTRKQNIPQVTTQKLLPGGQNLSEYFWESGKMRPRLGIKKRTESDRHFGNLKSGVVLNNLPSDLIGNYRATFDSLKYYLGKGEITRNSQENEVVYVPTGRLGETIDEEGEIDEDAMNPEFIRSITNNPDLTNSVTMRYVHRDSSDTPSMDRMPWENDMEAATEAEMEARNAAIALKRRSGSKKMKRLTVKLPNVPTVPQVQRFVRAPPTTPIDAKFPPVAPEVEQCDYCKKHENVPQRLPTISLPANLTHHEFGKELFNEDSGRRWYGVKPLINNELQQMNKEIKATGKQENNDSPPEPLNRTERLILAHGELKRRRHQCAQKEVLITPFTVKIDENPNDVAAASRKTLSNDFRRTISKPYTFSYMSGNRKKTRDVLSTNQIFNAGEVRANSRTSKADDAWYITNFVPVSQKKEPEMTSSKQPNDNIANSDVHTSDQSSLDKATGPDISEVKTKLNTKRRPRVKLVAHHQSTSLASGET